MGRYHLNGLNLRPRGGGLHAGRMAQRHCHGGSCALRPPHRLQRCQARLCVQVGSAATEQHGQVGLEGAWPAAGPLRRTSAGRVVGQPRPHKLGRVHLQQPAGGSEAAGRSAHPRWCRHAACGGGPGLPATAQASPPPASGLLLRECASFCKVAYSATVTPPALHTPTLSAFDAEVRACLEALCTGPLPGQAWAQASLATSAGGLGLRLALCGFCLLFGLFAFSVVASCLCFVSCFSAL